MSRPTELADEDLPGRAQVQDIETRQLFNEVATAWGQLETHGADLQEAMSTTHPPSMRNLILGQDGVAVSADEFDQIITHESPLYTAEVSNGETITLRSQNRNEYLPGFESVAGQGFRTFQGSETGYVPQGITVLIAYGSFIESQDNGFVLRITHDDVEYIIFHDGQEKEVRSLEDGDWDINPFNDPRYQVDLTRFMVIRHVFDLYGAGGSSLEMRVRRVQDEDGNPIDPEPNIVRPVSIATADDPVLLNFNQPNSIRVVNDGFAGDFKVGFGPTQFYNITDAEPNIREKKDVHRSIPVSPVLSDVQGRVLGVYRLDPGNLETLSTPVALDLVSSEDSSVEVRLIDPDHLDYPGVDPTVEGNWITVGEHNARDTVTQQLNFDPSNDDVTIQTFIDTDGEEKMRGHIIDQATTTRAVEAPRARDFGLQMDEFRYIVLTGRTRANSEIDELVLSFIERW